MGGKPVVVEYARGRPSPAVTPAAPADDTGAIAKARALYDSGNQHLFAGDTDGAIAQYQQALTEYPGYVAGYRGLGLAYAQQGDTQKARHALRTYLSAAPTAKDAPLIKKRLAMLQTAPGH
jgi:regulator of sirC expression with transglutaminase-like and TPR domain